MKKTLILATLTIFSLTSQSQNTKKMSFYDLKFKTLEGKEFKFSDLKGKKVLIVNTASKCGFTSQYAQLEEVYKNNKDKNFVVIGFPANNFGYQEPGTNAEIGEFCQKNYGVSFLMMEKSSVKGSDINPVYQWLTSKAQNGVADAKVSWNFNKFLVDDKGNWVAHYESRVSPTDKKITDFINQ